MRLKLKPDSFNSALVFIIVQFWFGRHSKSISYQTRSPPETWPSIVLSTETQRSESEFPLCVSAPLIIRLHNLQLRSISSLLLLSVSCHHYQQWQIGLISPSLPLSLKLNHKLAAGLHRGLSPSLMEVNWTRPFGYKLVVIVPGCRAAVCRKMGSDSPCSRVSDPCRA